MVRGFEPFPLFSHPIPSLLSPIRMRRLWEMQMQISWIFHGWKLLEFIISEASCIYKFCYQVFHRNDLCDRLVSSSVCLSVFTIQLRFTVFKYVIQLGEISIWLKVRVLGSTPTAIIVDFANNFSYNLTLSWRSWCNISLLSIPRECFMRSSSMSVRPSVCLSVYLHDNSGTSRRRMMKLCTIILEVKSNIEFKDETRTWPLTWSNWRFSCCTFRVHVRPHSVHVQRTHSCRILAYMCYSSLSLFTLFKKENWNMFETWIPCYCIKISARLETANGMIRE